MLILLFGSIGFTRSQSYFNYRFEFGQTGWWDGATNIFQLPDGFVIGGGYSFYGPMKLGFYKIDFLGNKIFSKIISDTADEFYLGNPGSIARLNDSMVVASGSRNSPAPGWGHQEGLVYFFDNNFDTLFTRYFGDKSPPVDTAIQFRQIKVISGNEIILVGGQLPQNSKTAILLMKIDRNGNKIWSKKYGYGSCYEGSSVILTSDNGFAIGGYTYDFLPPPNLTGDPVVYKTDSAGNFKWSFNYGTPNIDTPGMLSSTQDGKMVLGFAYCDSMSGGGPSAEGAPFRRINLIKIDNDGNVIWNKKYGISEYDKTLYNIRENQDGTLISTGITTIRGETYYKYAGWLLKTSPDGDSLWYRQYEICEGQSLWNWLYDAIETPDKGYLSCGVVYPQIPDTGSQDGWILKVDSLGCESLNYCWVGLENIPIPSENDGIEIYPNPGKEFINVHFHLPNENLQLLVTLCDFTGRIVRMGDLHTSNKEMRFDVSLLPRGLYILHITESSGQTVSSKKIIII